MKKIITFVCLFLLSLGLVACKDESDDKEEDEKKTVDVDLPAEFNGIIKDNNFYLTTVGQADINIVFNILVNVGIDEALLETKQNNTLKASDITASDKPVVLMVVGGSSKGLGSAGVKIEDEKVRAEGFVQKAVDGDIKLIVIHIGGADRRGALTDPILNVVCKSADLMMVVESGDNDNYFTKAAKENNIPLNLYSRYSNMVAPFKTLFGLK